MFVQRLTGAIELSYSTIQRASPTSVTFMDNLQLMCPFDLPLHYEENHLNKHGWCKFIALIWILFPWYSCSLWNWDDLFRITQTRNMSDSHPKAFVTFSTQQAELCQLFPSGNKNMNTIHKTDREFIMTEGLQPALQSINQSYSLQNICVCPCFNRFFFGDFSLYLILIVEYRHGNRCWVTIICSKTLAQCWKIMITWTLFSRLYRQVCSLPGEVPTWRST